MTPCFCCYCVSISAVFHISLLPCGNIDRKLNLSHSATTTIVQCPISYLSLPSGWRSFSLGWSLPPGLLLSLDRAVSSSEACIGDGCLGWWYRSMLQHKQIKHTKACMCWAHSRWKLWQYPLSSHCAQWHVSVETVPHTTRRAPISNTLESETANRRASLSSVDAKRNIYAPLFQSHFLRFVFIFLPQAFPACQHFYETFVSLSLAWQKGEKKPKTKPDSVLHEGHSVPLSLLH